MPVVQRYAPGYPDPTNVFSQFSRNTHAAAAPVRCARFRIAIPASNDDPTSTYFLARLPSDAIIKPISAAWNTALTGLTSLHVGVQRRGVVAANALVNAQSLATAGTFNLLAAVAAVNHDRALWQHLGLAQDPGDSIDIYATVNALPTAAGTFHGDIYYTKPA